MKTSTLSKKGWVVIPNDVRKRYNLKKGDKVNIIDYGGVISIIPVSKNPVKDTAGILKGKTSLTEALLKYRKEEKAREK